MPRVTSVYIIYLLFKMNLKVFRKPYTDCVTPRDYRSPPLAVTNVTDKPLGGTHTRVYIPGKFSRDPTIMYCTQNIIRKYGANTLYGHYNLNMNT